MKDAFYQILVWIIGKVCLFIEEIVVDPPDPIETTNREMEDDYN